MGEIMKVKQITAEIVNPEAIVYASEEFTKLLLDFYLEENSKENTDKN
jgi:hypothetical protein